MNGRTDVCPVVDALSAAPTTVAAGDTINLRARVSDEDDSSLTYDWKADSAPTFTANVGDPFPLPSFTILSGIDESGAATDADGDGNPDVTLPTNIGGLLALDAYVGLKLDTSITANVAAPDELSGTTAFSVTGTVFGSNNPVLSTGNINVTPASSEVPVTSRRLDGDVPCSEIGSMF